jgi:hypothetical protein
MDKTDIVHALNKYVETLNIVLKTFQKTQGHLHEFKHLIKKKTTTINLYLLFSEMFSVQYSVFQHICLMHEQYQFCPWCKDCVTPQTFSITIVNKHIIP